MNKSRIITLSIIAALIAILTVFGKTTIEEYKTEIKTLRTEITTIRIDNKELSIMLKESSSSKDIVITETKNKDGSYTKTKRIKTKKDSSISKTVNKERSESSKTTILEKSNIKNSSKIVTNPKKLNLSVGFDNSLDYSLHLNYNLIGPLTVGGWIKSNELGIKIGVSF